MQKKFLFETILKVIVEDFSEESSDSDSTEIISNYFNEILTLYSVLFSGSIKVIFSMTFAIFDDVPCCSCITL